MACLETGVYEPALTGGGILNTRGPIQQRFVIRSALMQDRGYYPPNQRLGNSRGAISEVGVNWGTFPSSANLTSWFWEDIQDMRMHTSHNKHKGVAHHQPGGTATFACMDLVRYHKQKGDDFRGLG
jgi:hypothetical protein